MDRGERRETRPHPGLVQPPGQIGFIQEKRETRIEPAERLQRLPPDRHIGAFQLDRLPHWQRPIQRMCHALGIDAPLAPLHGYSVAAKHGPGRGHDLRIGERRGQMVQPGRLRHRVIVDEGQDLARRQTRRLVARGGDIRLGLMPGLDPLRKRQVRDRHQPGLIGHHDQFERAMEQLADPDRRAAQQLGPPVADDDDADGWALAQGSPISASIASIRGTSSGLFNSQNLRPRASTSTQSTLCPASRNRNCSSPSSTSSLPTGQVG